MTLAKRSAISFFAFFLGGSLCLAETLQEKAERIHQNTQEPSESVVLGELSGSDAEYGEVGVLRKDGPRADENTLYEIGSITKVFTAILLAETVREGKAALSDPVGKFLPDGLLEKESPLLSSVSLEALATHRSGLVRIPGDLYEGAEKDDPYAHYDVDHLHAYLEGITKEDLKTEGEYVYSNLGFGLLGHLLARIHGKSYSKLIQERICEPLGMTDTLVPNGFATLPKEIQNQIASGHNGGKEVPHWNLSSLEGAGAILSSAHDLLIFAKAHWSGETPPGLAKSLKMVAVPRKGALGLAWNISDGKIEHGGGTGGFRTNLWIDVAKTSAGVMLKNSSGESLERVTRGEFSTISGFWEGTLEAEVTKLRLVKYIGSDGRMISFSLDQGCGYTESTKMIFQNGRLFASFPTISGTYKGERKGNQLVGIWNQGRDLALTLSWSDDMPEALKSGLSKKYPDDLTPLTGYWSGFLGGKKGLFVYFKIEPFHDHFLVNLFSPDQTPSPIGVSRLTLDDNRVNASAPGVGGKFRGKLAPGKKTISGTWTQGPEQPLNLKWTAEIPARD